MLKQTSQSYSHLIDLLSLLSSFVIHGIGNGENVTLLALIYVFPSVSQTTSCKYRQADPPPCVSFCLQLHTDTHAYTHMHAAFLVKNMLAGQKTGHPMKYDRKLCQLLYHFWCNGKH